ncbi:uncharacterized protein MAL13P1.304-like [Condylostylus longicornis]|uniref:uncharacterized protein MAL13P1.304-like n=1 Tax=Condylostylus longicornis TaxID=2530218 RepID=UPI00244D9BEA|nr:uncharacterized protein MAL13P1.304-like [Condylostylus longicornis]
MEALTGTSQANQDQQLTLQIDPLKYIERLPEFDGKVKEEPNSNFNTDTNIKTALEIFKDKLPEPMRSIIFSRNPSTLEEAIDILHEGNYAYYNPLETKIRNNNNRNHQKNPSTNRNNYSHYSNHSQSNSNEIILLSRLEILPKDVLTNKEINNHNVSVETLPYIRNSVFFNDTTIVFVISIPNFLKENCFRNIIVKVPNKDTNLELDTNFNKEKNLIPIQDECVSNLLTTNLMTCHYKQNLAVEIKPISRKNQNLKKLIQTKNVTQLSNNNKHVPLQTSSTSDNQFAMLSEDIDIDENDENENNHNIEVETDSKESDCIDVINNNKHAIYVENLDVYKKVKEGLDLIEADYYSFTPSIEKNKTYLLKGLQANENEQDIQEYLRQLNCNSIEFVKVNRFSTTKSKNENKILPLFLVQISPNSNPKELYNIKYVNNQLVHWEKLRKNDILQCKRCQRFGHAAPNCRLEYRCVKCSENHGPGECKLNRSENHEIKPYCVLCKASGHPASFKGCPDIKNIRMGERQLVNTSYINPNKTFSSLFQDNNKTKPNTDENDIKNCLEQIMTRLEKLNNTANENSKRIDILFNILRNDDN